jgi:TrmH family RNA methyltransferase
VVAVFPKPVFDLDKSALKDGYVFLLDNINDPGNLGTIIRTAHWFGIHHLYITRGSVEVFSPKVVQSSMGSLAAIKVYIIENEEFISDLAQANIPIYLADTGGKQVRSARIHSPACIVFGNESNGISEIWRKAATGALTITSAQPQNQPESLNVAVSVAIFMELLTTL